MNMKKNELNLLMTIGAAILFVNNFIPLIESTTDLIQSFINAKINRMQMDLELEKRECMAAAEKIAPSPQITQAIGFQADTEPDYEEEYE